VPQCESAIIVLVRLHDLLYDLAAWIWPRRFIPRGTVIRPMPETPEEIEEAKREFLRENPPEPGRSWTAYSDVPVSDHED
jgi:hypothetical protein